MNISVHEANLVWLKNFNSSLFHDTLIPGLHGVTKFALKGLTKLMIRPWVWATCVEVMAAATLFQ